MAPFAEGGKRRAVASPSSGCPPMVLSRGEMTSDVALDGDHLYFFGTEDEVWRVHKNGGTPERLAVTDTTPFRIAFDAERMYFATMPPGSDQATIWSIPKSGGTPLAVTTSVAFPRDLVVDGGYVYWSSRGTVGDGFLNPDGSVGRVRTDGSGREVLASKLHDPSEIALDATHVYFGESLARADEFQFGVRRVPREGGIVETIAENLLTFALTMDDQFVYAGGIDFDAETFTVARIAKDGSSYENLRTGDFIAYDLHVSRGELLFYSSGDEEIGFVVLDLSTRASRLLIADTSMEGDSFAVDDCAIYYSTDIFASIPRELRRHPRQ